MNRNKIVAIIFLLIILPSLFIRNHSPSLDILRGISLIGYGIFVGWPYWRGNKKAQGILLGVAGCVVGVCTAIFLN